MEENNRTEELKKPVITDAEYIELTEYILDDIRENKGHYRAFDVLVPVNNVLYFKINQHGEVLVYFNDGTVLNCDTKLFERH